MDKLFQNFNNVNMGEIIFIGVIILVISGIFWLFYHRHKVLKREKEEDTNYSLRNTIKSSPINNQNQTPKPDDQSGQTKEIVKPGIFPAYVCTDDSFDFRLIPEALGKVWTADPSMPKSGDCYLVKEVNGKLTTYDPRESELLSKETPSKAWFATHWPIVNRIFSVPKEWWKSTSMWITVGVGVCTFIIVLATVGG